MKFIFFCFLCLFLSTAAYAGHDCTDGSSDPSCQQYWGGGVTVHIGSGTSGSGSGSDSSDSGSSGTGGSGTAVTPGSFSIDFDWAGFGKGVLNYFNRAVPYCLTVAGLILGLGISWCLFRKFVDTDEEEYENTEKDPNDIGHKVSKEWYDRNERFFSSSDRRKYYFDEEKHESYEDYLESDED